MDDMNTLQILDKIKKNIERGAVPIAMIEIESTMTMIDRKINLAKGKRFDELHIQQDLPLMISETSMATQKELTETRQKCNEIIRFLNERFPVQ